jgi:putative addiction module killer protein
MIEVREYLDKRERSPFGIWFKPLDKAVAAKVAVSITGLALGNLSNVKGVGGGVLEYRLDFGPGFRIYFGRDGETVVILLGGARGSGSEKTFRMRWSGGRTIRSGSSRRNRYGSYARL